jgi:NAD-dependent SIR2 family protein deacetylase
MLKKRKILIVAGAGMSADSNLPTYQMPEELWKLYPYYETQNIKYRTISRATLFRTKPMVAWGFYSAQTQLYTQAIPHDGYFKLLDSVKNNDYFIITTNVDDLFVKAGFDTKKIHYVHGSIFELQCSKPCSQKVWKQKDISFTIDSKTMTLPYNQIPLCPECGAIARPNIFLFGDHTGSYVEQKNNLKAKAFLDWLFKEHMQELIVIEIGVGGEGLRRHAIDYCKKFASFKYIVINPLSYAFDIKTIHLQGKANDMLAVISTYIENTYDSNSKR